MFTYKNDAFSIFVVGIPLLAIPIVVDKKYKASISTLFTLGLFYYILNTTTKIWSQWSVEWYPVVGIVLIQLQ